MTGRNLTLGLERRAGTRTMVALGDLSVAAVLILAGVVSVWVVTGWFGADWMRGRAASLAVLGAATAAAIYATVRLRPAGRSAGWRAAVALAVPAMSILGVLAASWWVRGSRQLEWFLNGDHPRHLVFVADTWVQGQLGYSTEGYPRGWHTFMASVWSVSGAGLDSSSILRLMAIMASASLLLSALLALAMAHLGHDLADRAGLARTPSVVVGVLTGLTCLLADILGSFQALGGENSLVAAVAVAACCRETVIGPGSVRAVLATAAGSLVVAHAWQLLLPTLAVLAFYNCWMAVRTRDVRTMAVVGAIWAVTIPLAASGLLGALGRLGLSYAASPGPDTPVPVVLLVVGTCSAVVITALERDSALAAVLAASLMSALTAFGLVLILHIHPLTYYPSKLLWQSAVVATPWLFLLLSVLVQRLARHSPALRRPVAAVVGVACGAFAAFALLQPWGALVGAWSTVDGARVLAALRTPEASRADVVWLEGTRTTDAMARILLDAFRVRETTTRVPQGGLTVGQECDLLLRSTHPTVLSTAAPSAVRTRYACVPDVVVIRAAQG